MRATWKPHEKSGTLTKRADLPDSVFAYPHERKEPMTNATHVRNALARFDQVEGVSESARDLAFANIKKAAKHYDVDVSEASRAELGEPPKRKKSAPAARKAIASKKAPARKTTSARKKATRKKTTGKKTRGEKK